MVGFCLTPASIAKLAERNRSACSRGFMIHNSNFSLEEVPCCPSFIIHDSAFGFEDR